jgi:soluble lytic murein transglycosylase-like protein
VTTYPYARIVAAAAKRHGVPYGVLLGLLLHEDASGNPRAVSSTGDYGPAQIHLASHPGVSRSQAENPAFAINWAAEYLASLHARCGTWAGALTQYNHGVALGCQPSTYSDAVLSIAARHGYAGEAPAQPSTSNWEAWAFWALVAALVLVVLLGVI